MRDSHGRVNVGDADMWQSRHSAEPAQVGGDVQGRRRVGVSDAVVLGSDGRVQQHRAVAVPALRVGSHAPSTHHRRLQRPRLCHPGPSTFSTGHIH